MAPADEEVESGAEDSELAPDQFEPSPGFALRMQRRGRGNPGQSTLHEPPTELPAFAFANFFDEARVGAAEEREARRKFGKWRTKVPTADGAEEEEYVTLEAFQQMLQYYGCASPEQYEAFFNAMDRNRDGKVDFAEFYQGCVAADPSTVHILNSHTGSERTKYIFDFYDADRSGLLEFGEFSMLVNDVLKLSEREPEDRSPEELLDVATQKAAELRLLRLTSGGEWSFVPPNVTQLIALVTSERLRGTSRLFRFTKSLARLPMRANSSRGRQLGQGGA